MIQVALYISKAVRPSRDVITEFVELITQLLEAWNTMKSQYTPIIQRLCEELPIAQAQQFWPLLLCLVKCRPGVYHPWSAGAYQ